MSENKNEIMANNTTMLDNTNRATFCSFSAATNEEKILMYNAINNPDYKVSDMINREIDIRDVVIMDAEMVNDDTGEVEFGYRSVIIDKEGNSYHAVSNGIYNALKNINLIFGTLHFDAPMVAIVKQIATKRGSTLTLTLK